MDAPDHPPAPETERATPRADVRRRSVFSWVWAIPVVSVLIGGWLGFKAIVERGPLITVDFQSAEGLQAGQSHLRYKQVDVGTVQTIGLDKGLKQVQVTIRVNREASSLLHTGTRFWVVKPRLFAGTISGLDTLLSGAYVALSPGPAEGDDDVRTFEGLENPPILENTEPGRTFLLKAPRIGSISLGSPVFYRDFDVGEVLGWDVADMARSVTLHVLVRAPFEKYVHDQSRFWNASGAQLKIGGTGVQLQVQSVRALLLGGIAFDTPEEERGKPASGEGHEFPLFADQDAANSASFATKVPFVAYFDDSVAGLGAPSDVLLQGLRIGDVQSVSLEFDAVRNRSRAVVKFQVEPDRIQEPAGQVRPDALVTARELLKRGMRAQLISGSLITGSMNLGIVFGDGKELAEVRTDGDRLVVPTTPGGGLGDVATSASALLTKLRELPIEQIGANLNATLAGAAAVTNGPALTQTLLSAQATMRDLQETVRHLDQGTAPLLRQLPEIAAGLRDTVNRANKLIGSAQSGYGDDSKFQRDLERVLAQLSEAARSVRALADLLDQHPEALIRGRTSKAE